MAKVIEVTDQSFEEEVLESDVPTEVDFWAPWCGPCNMVSPIYDKLSGEYENFKFCKIDVDQNPQTAMKYQIMSIPMQMFFANGEKVDEILGAVPEEMIRSKVEDILNRFPTDEKGMLEVILGSWVDQNKKHAEKFNRWKEKTNSAENLALYDPVLQAVTQMQQAGAQILEALTALQDEG
jgi:thioredoxin 1